MAETNDRVAQAERHREVVAMFREIALKTTPAEFQRGVAGISQEFPDIVPTPRPQFAGMAQQRPTQPKPTA